jgi:hypothetical protein
MPRMTARERFHETFHYGQPDRVFMMPQWVFGVTRQRWAGEGMPNDRHFDSYHGYDRYESLLINNGPVPAFETKILERTAEWAIIEDEMGAVLKRWTDREIGMFQWYSYAIRGREQWERFKQHLNPDSPSRYPEYWDDLKRCYRERDYPLGIHMGSFYGWIRNWVGMEHLALWYYDDPDLVHEMSEYVADFMLKLIDRALTEIPDLDFAIIWEDMCHKTGSLISPALFREFHLEPLKRVTKVVREAGIDILMLDCDGRVDDMLPLWLEAGVNLHYPLEAASGCDPLHYRELYGKDILLLGAIDKRVLREDCTKADIEREVMAKVPPLVAQGGFSPWVDHAVPPDVPYANFKYFLDLINEICTA